MRRRLLRCVVWLGALLAMAGGTRSMAAHGGAMVANTEVFRGAGVPHWSLAFPVPGGNLLGVSCVSSTACMAIGGFLGPTSAWWGGKRWQPYTTRDPALPNAPNPSFLSGVSCTSRLSCIAVGTYDGGRDNIFSPFAEEWNGSRWTLQATPTPPGIGPDSEFRAISCPSADDCVAVGYDYANHPLAEHWDGATWTVEPTGAIIGLFNGVSCTTATVCAAVGSMSTPLGEQALVGTWDGTRWFVQAAPGTGVPSELRGVSCASSRACTAVGVFYRAPPFGSAAVAEAWNGSVWSPVEPPVVGAGSELNGVSCSSSHACTAVGDWYATAPPEGLAKTLGERWNGTQWTVEPTPSVRNDPGGGSYLNAVSCTTGRVCVAVGNDQGSTGLAEHRTLRQNFSVSGVQSFVDGTVRLRVRVPAPGSIDVLETAWNDNLARTAALLQPAPRRFVFARAHAAIAAAGSAALTIAPGRRGRQLVQHPRYRVTLRLWVTYTPSGHGPETIGFRGVHLATLVASTSR